MKHYVIREGKTRGKGEYLVRYTIGSGKEDIVGTSVRRLALKISADYPIKDLRNLARTVHGRVVRVK